MAVVKEVWRILSLPCSDAAALMSQAMDGPVPRHLRLAVALHRFVCKGCRAYRRQLLAMRAALREFGGITHPAASPQPLMSPEARERIERALHGAQAP